MSRPPFGTKGAAIRRRKGGNDDDEDRPEHIDREPDAQTAYSRLLSSSTTVDFETRSVLAPLPHPPSHTTLLQEFDQAAQEASACFDRVCAAVDQNDGKPFFDQSFFLGSRQNLYPDGAPDDCTVGEPIDIIRVQEYLPDAPLFSSNVATQHHEVMAVQHDTGDCFMLAAISAVSSFAKRLRESGQDPSSVFSQAQFANPLQRLFVKADVQRSVYAVVLYGVGRWEWVIVDGTLAANDDGTPLYATCRPDSLELWPMILEKSYFKFFRTVDACDGGMTAEAICTFTGGCQMHVDLDRLKFDKLFQIGQNPMNVLSTGVKDKIPPSVKAQYAAASGKRGRCGEESAVAGLTGGHAYSVVAVKKTSDGHGFILVQNPWAGSGVNSKTEDSASEWFGPWSDKSKLWQKHPNYKAEVGYVDRDDGCFFMACSDFQKLMTLEVCSFFSDRNQLLTMSNIFHSDRRKEADDVLILKMDKKSHIRVILGGYSSRWAPALLGEKEETHLICKNKEDWDLVTPEPGLEVNYHPKGCPTPQTWRSATKKKLGHRSASWSETVFIDLDVPFDKGYISICPQMEPGCPYYVRVVAPEDAQCTLFQLSKGLESAAGKTDIKLRVEKRHDNANANANVNNNNNNVPHSVGAINNEDELADGRDDDDVDAGSFWDQGGGEDDEDADWEEWDEEGEEYEEDEEEDDWCDDDWYGDDDDEDSAAWDEYSDYDPENDYEWSDDEEGDEEEEDVDYNDEDMIGEYSIGQLRKWFEQFDLDGSGELDKQEVTACFLHFFPDLRPYQMMKTLEKFDTNQDGKLSFKEFLGIAKSVSQEEDEEEYEDDSYDDEEEDDGQDYRVDHY